MPGRPTLKPDDEPRRDNAGRPSGQIPFGAMLLLLTIALVFLYGIVLKATGPSVRASTVNGSPPRAVERSAASWRALPGASSSSGASGQAPEDEPLEQGYPGSIDSESPVIPESVSIGTSEGTGSVSAQVHEAPTSLRGASPAPRFPSRDTALSPAPSHEPPTSPRGPSPALARKKARQLFTAKEYPAAARTWSEWAGSTPPGAWTVQIAAVNLERAASNDSLARIAARDEVFILAPGALPGGLAPVCAGIYDSEQAARRAAASLGPLAGPAGRPIAKPVSSLLAAKRIE